MPSGLTHIMLVDEFISSLWENSPENPVVDIFQNNYECFLTGSVGPDLPYASEIDVDFFTKQTELADLFHYETTNQIPLKAFEQIEAMPNSDIKNKLFSFFLGYSSHIIADGIIHPFVRDKIGEYQTHSAEHRGLELTLDVLIHDYFHSDNGTSDIRKYNKQDIFKDFLMLPEKTLIVDLFSNLISDVYGKQASSGRIKIWIRGIYDAFNFTTGDWPKWTRKNDLVRSYLTPNISDVINEKDKYLILTTPKYWNENFLKRDSISLTKDCIPQFFKVMKAFSQKAYSFVYDMGVELTGKDLPNINLDNGLLHCQTPRLWEKSYE